MRTQFVIAGIIVLGLAVGGYWFLGGGSDGMMQKDAMSGENMQQATMTKDDPDGSMESGAMMEKGAMQDGTKAEDTMMEKGDTMETSMMKKGGYEDYAPEKLAIAGRGDVLLFFHADWCPVCRSLEAEIKANSTALGDVTILKVDYDAQTALKQKYGVTVQHTFVQVDASGNMLGKWSDTSTLDRVLAKVK